MKRSIPLAAVLCAVLFLPVARGRAQDLYVGSNAANVTTNFTSGTNLFANVYVGYSSNVSTFSATNNLLNVSGSGTLLTNTNDFFVGVNGSGSRLVISNGGQVATARYAYIGYSSLASNSSALVTGTNSRWTALGFDLGYNIDLGFPAGWSSLVISNGGQALATSSVRIGGYSSSNSVLVSGAGSLLSASVDLGGNVGVGHYNSLVISNGGTVTSTNPSVGASIGNNSSNNTVLVTGNGSAWTESGGVILGFYTKGTGNRLIVSNSGTVTIAGGTTIGGNNAWDPTLSGNASNSVLVTGTNSSLTSSGRLVVGQNSDGNSLTISDGGSVICGTNLTINQLYQNTNGNYVGSLVLVQSGRLVVTNGQINFGAGRGILQIDGGTVEVKELLATTPITPAGQITPAERRGSFVLLNGGTIISGATTISNETGKSDNRTFFIGGNSGSGATFMAKGGTHTFWANVAVGDSGSSNSLVITNGAEVFLKSRPDPNHGPSGGTNFVIGVATGAANNSVSISSGRFVMTNGTLEVGRAGSGTLNVHGGVVQAPSIVVASQAGSSGTLNIGRFGTNDSAGTISAPSIAFGSGAGVVNFNQSNAVTITSVISGGGTVRQLGSGTTILSASNTYTGGTVISAGTLELDNTGSVAGNITNNATLAINRTNSLTLTNVVSGTGALSKSGAGTVIFTGANTYSGNTTISAGTLQINAGGVVSNSATTLVGSGGSGTLNISGGTYSNLNLSIGHSGGTGILNLNSGSLSAQNLAVSGNSAAAGTLNLNGGTMAVAGSFYVASGGTINVNTGGVLRGGDGGHLWADATNSLINFNGGAGSSGLNLFVGNGGTVDLRGQSLGANNWGNLIASAPGGVLRNSGSNASTIATANTIWLWQGGQKLTIDASGGDILINSWITSSQMTNTGIIKTGSNALVLTYSGNDYNGGTLLQQGSLRLDHANAAGSGAITQSNAASTLQINATGTVANAMSLYNLATLQTVTLSGSKTLNGSTYNIAAGTTTTESGVLSGAGGLTKSGTGTMTLSASNSYSGDTTISSGVLALTNGFSIADTAAVTNSGATLRVDSGETIGSLRGSGSTVLNGMAVTLTIAETNSHAYAGVISGAGGFAKTGGGTTTLAGSNTYSGDTTVGGGRLAVTGSISGSNAVYVGNEASGNSLIISNGGRVANGQGSIGYTVSSSNNSALVTGANAVWTNSGYFYVGAYGSSNSLVVSNGGTVAALISQIGTFGSSLNNSVLVTGTNSLLNNALYLFVGGSGNSGNSMVISNGGLVTVGIHSYVGGDVASDNNSVLVTGAGSRWSNAFGLFVGNAGLSNSLTVANGGNASAGSGLTIAASNGSVATLNIGHFGTNDTGGTIITPTIAFGAGTGVINFNQSDAVTITSVISGAGTLNQLGTGTTVLSGGSANTYSGTTTVSGGTLNLNKTAGVDAIAGAVVVNSGAILLLSSSDNVNNTAAVTLSGGTITRGSGVSETFGALDITGSGILDFGTGATGNLTFGTYQSNAATPSALLTLNNFIPGNAFTFASTSFSTNNLGNYFTFGTGYVNSSITDNGSETFTITAIPEPSAYVAAIALLALLLWPLRRRWHGKVS